MKIVTILLFFAFNLFAFNVNVIDETQTTKDGKPLLRPMQKKILKPLKKVVIEPTPKKVLKPMQKIVIYPVNKQPIINKSSKAEKKLENNSSVFAKKEQLKVEENSTSIEIDKFFKGLKESNKTENIKPVNLE